MREIRVALLAASVLPRMRLSLRAAIRRDLQRRPCFQCGYSALGLSDPRWPECGTSFAPTV